MKATSTAYIANGAIRRATVATGEDAQALRQAAPNPSFAIWNEDGEVKFAKHFGLSSYRSRGRKAAMETLRHLMHHADIRGLAGDVLDQWLAAGAADELFIDLHD